MVSVYLQMDGYDKTALTFSPTNNFRYSTQLFDAVTNITMHGNTLETFLQVNASDFREQLGEIFPWY